MQYRDAALVGVLATTLAACGQSPPQLEVEAEAAVSNDINTALATAVHVRVEQAARATITQQAAVSGVVEAFRKTTVAAEVAGRVVARGVEPGDAVAEGEVLITLDKERASIARQESEARMRAAQVNLAQATRELKRGENLRARQFISEDALEALRFAVQRAASELAAAEASLAAAQRALTDTVIRAPFAGSAERVHVQQGDFLNAGTAVVTLADFSQVRIRAGVTAKEAALLARSSTAELTLDALGTITLQGRIHNISRIADVATGTYDVEIWLQNTDGRLREGMLAAVRLPYSGDSASLVVPSAAVFRRNGTFNVFTVENERAFLRPVETGRSSGTHIEITAGISPGAQVVIDGQFALRDGAAVTVDKR